MNSQKRYVVLLALISLFLLPLSVFPCACCVDPGYYEISTIKPSSYDLGTLGDMIFSPNAQLYQSEAGFDDIRGLDDLQKDEVAGSVDLSVEETFMGKTWRLKLKTDSGREGAFVLPMPPTMVRFKVDQHENEPGTETYLYKEMRLKGAVGSGTGFLRKSIARPTTYFLVFQGHGNGCDSAADYSHWRLELSGPKAKYAFFGQLSNGQADAGF